MNMNRKNFLSVTLASVLLIGSFGAAVLAEAGSVPGSRYIVVFKDGTDSVAASQRLTSKYGLELGRVYRHALPGMTVRGSLGHINELREESEVLFVSEDHPVRATARPDNPGKPDKGAVSTQNVPSGIMRIGAAEAASRGAGIQVAVLDTGIDVKHPDLAGNVLGGYNCVGERRFVDDNGHGTHVAGIIAALDNDIGVVGVAPEAKLWSVKVLDMFGSGSWSSVICGLDYVAANAPANGGEIRVVNLSLGGVGISDDDCGFTSEDPLHQAICRVRDAGVTIVVAAGNDAISTSTSVPAAYDDAVITVSALADSDGEGGGLGPDTEYGLDDTFANFSNYGSSVDLGAPGVNILSTAPGRGYAVMSGTSMASPHAAGAAALYLSAKPDASWVEVRDVLVGLAELDGNGHVDSSGLHFEPVLDASRL